MNLAPASQLLQSLRDRDQQMPMMAQMMPNLKVFITV